MTKFDGFIYPVALSCEEVGVTVIGVLSIEPGGRVRFNLFLDIIDIFLILRYHISKNNQLKSAQCIFKRI